MLPSINRLKKKKDFERVFKKGKGYKERFLSLKIINNNLETSRFGFIVSRKFSAKATIRNKIKRRLRDIIKTNLPNIKNGIDVAIMVIPGCKEIGFQELKEIVNKLLNKAKIYNRSLRSL